MIKFENVSHCFGKKTPFAGNKKIVLAGVDFELEKGKIICLLGPSGCGKTTMVNLIMGKLIPSEGSVTVMGERAPYRTVRQQIGYMPQEDALYEDITAADNLKFFGAMNGMKNRDIKERVDKMLEPGRLKDEGKTLGAPSVRKVPQGGSCISIKFVSLKRCNPCGYAVFSFNRKYR